jgi:hypothetical protein
MNSTEPTTRALNSMSNWIERTGSASDGLHTVTTKILAEELSKSKRLNALAEQIGLPIYDVREYKLPQEIEPYRIRCADITRDGTWRIAIRFARPPLYDAFVRVLGADLAEALQAAEAHKTASAFIAQVTPYRTPDQSGTLLVRRGEARLELVFGPHSWISKAPPTQDAIIICNYELPDLSIQYSVDKTDVRQLMYRHLVEVVRMVLGYGISGLRESGLSVYTEFHWHKHIGYRFLECSFSPVWTGLYQ